MSENMKYVTGIGGIFFKAEDPEKLGYFGWAMDPKGNRIELRQPPETP
jgi:catechol 2,3-dioxygenase-like lactoylglutathione lyase family enzyme